VSALGTVLAEGDRAKPVGVFGSFGWSGEALDLLESKLRDGGFRFAFDPIRVKFSPDPAMLKTLEETGTALGRRLRIRCIQDSRLGPTDPEIVAGLHHAVGVLTSLGHTVEEGSLPDSSVEEFLPLWQHQVAQVPIWSWRRTQPVTRWLGEAGRALRAADVRRLFDRLIGRFAPAFAAADMWVMPTVAVPAPRVGAFRGLPAADAFARAAELAAFVKDGPVATVGRLRAR
jgi:Asp-tRNA(Asn)/Glu-tRNA(Gln) amidotransferase A subunit family amidase